MAYHFCNYPLHYTVISFDSFALQSKRILQKHLLMGNSSFRLTILQPLSTVYFFFFRSVWSRSNVLIALLTMQWSQIYSGVHIKAKQLDRKLKGKVCFFFPQVAASPAKVCIFNIHLFQSVSTSRFYTQRRLKPTHIQYKHQHHKPLRYYRLTVPAQKSSLSSSNKIQLDQQSVSKLMFDPAGLKELAHQFRDLQQLCKP